MHICTHMHTHTHTHTHMHECVCVRARTHTQRNRNLISNRKEQDVHRAAPHEQEQTALKSNPRSDHVLAHQHEVQARHPILKDRISTVTL